MTVKGEEVGRFPFKDTGITPTEPPPVAAQDTAIKDAEAARGDNSEADPGVMSGYQSSLLAREPFMCLNCCSDEEDGCN